MLCFTFSAQRQRQRQKKRQTETADLTIDCYQFVPLFDSAARRSRPSFQQPCLKALLIVVLTTLVKGYRNRSVAHATCEKLTRDDEAVALWPGTRVTSVKHNAHPAHRPLGKASLRGRMRWNDCVGAGCVAVPFRAPGRHGLCLKTEACTVAKDVIRKAQKHLQIRHRRRMAQFLRTRAHTRTHTHTITDTTARAVCGWL